MGGLGFWATAQDDPEHLAVVEPDGTEVSAGALLERANRLVHGMRDAGMEPGDVVATVLPNGGDFLALYLAALQAGWYLVPINHHLVAPEVAYILQNSDAKVFVGHERFGEVCLAAAEEAGVPAPRRFAIGEVEGLRPFAELSDGQPSTLPPERLAGAVMNYTSGTTGKPKGIRRPLAGMSPEDAAIGFGGLLLLFGVQPHDGNVHLIGSPLYHTAVMVFGGGSLHLGHTVVVMDKWTPDGMLGRIERYRVTTSHLVPTQFRRMLALPEEQRRGYDLSSMRHMIHAAAPCPVEVKRRMIEWWGPVVDEYYAASEGGGTFVSSEEWLTKPGTLGKPWPISEIAIFDDGHNRLGAGEVGTVYMSMASVDFAYHKDEAKTQANRIDKYFTVGDVGFLDDDGWLFLCDRKIDMVISGGANVYPAEIEGVLVSHPKVMDAAAFGIPDDDWGEVVKAVVEPVDDVDPPPGPQLEAELLDWCAGQLAKFKLPRSIDFVGELPRDPNGKLQKRRLRDPYWVGRERKI